jgi:hypothetical protein
VGHWGWWRWGEGYFYLFFNFKDRLKIMPRAQTVFSELQVALAMVDGDWSRINNVDQQSKSLYEEELKKRLAKDPNSIKELTESGKKIKKWLKNQHKIDSLSLQWTGKEKITDYSSVGYDLLVEKPATRISIKENAQLFQNPSPFKVFDRWPRGIFDKSRDSDWFIHTAKAELNEYYKYCGGPKVSGHMDIEKYYQNTSGKDKRKNFTNHVAALHDKQIPNVMKAYQNLCQKVSTESAKIFNSHIKKMNLKDKKITQNLGLAKLFAFYFRLDDQKYTLTGTENAASFAIEILDLKSWESSFEVVEVSAVALERGQPEVLISFEFLNKKTKENFNRKIRAEVRWSHGKFCGNPESKLYKHDSWSYSELPWVMTV